MEGGVRSGEERGAEKHMDEYLKSIGLVRKRIAKDGSCLFRAVAEQVLHCQNLHTEIRSRCVDFLRRNRDDYEAFIEGDFEDYLFKLRDPQQWVGEVEIHALSVMYKRDFLIFQEPGKPAVPITDNNFKDKVRLCFLNGNHYDSVYPDDHVRNTALCQSVLYELLYDGVFNVDRSLLKLCHRTGRASDVLSDDSMAACRSSDDSDGGADEPLWVDNETTATAAKPNAQSHRGRGRGRQLPERVRRSLNPTLLRNIEYDVWQKSKRAQQKMDYSIAAGMHFTVGDRCQVRLESNGRSYSAIVREVPLKNGPVSVYIEDLGLKQVPLWSLQPVRDDGGWSMVVSRDRKLSNGHGDWDERGRGRGRGKNATSSSANPPASATPGGRVQKQQSWPTGEEQGAKGSRKPLSSVEVAFGLTVEQRQAREEEERNVALVEIQLRDELSFPALGKQAATSSEGGKKKAEKRNSTQRNKTKSPVEDERPPSPPTSERPKSSAPPAPGPTPPTATAPGATAPTPGATAVVTPAPGVAASVPEANPPAVKPPPPISPAKFPGSELSFLGDSLLDETTATGSASKTTTSFASVASPPLPVPLPPAGRSTNGVFSFLTPALPPASASPPGPPTFIAPIAPSPTGFPPRPSPSPPSIARHEAQLPAVGTPSKLLPKAGSSLLQNQIKISAPQTGTQLQDQGSAPVLQHQDTMTQSPEPPVQSQETTIQNQSLQNQGTMSSSPQNQSLQNQGTMSSSPQVQSLQNQGTMSSSPQVQSLQNQDTMPSRPQVQSPTLPIQNPETVIQNQNLQHQETVSSRAQIQIPDQHLMPSGAQFQTLGPDVVLQYQDQMVPAAPPQFDSPGPQNPETMAAAVEIQTQSPALQDQDTEPSRLQAQSQGPTSGPQSQDTVQTKAPSPVKTSAILGPTAPQQLPQVYQDLLYPGFPHGEKGDVTPTLFFSSNKSGDDLPRDVNILRFFYNLGVKAYSMPTCFPYLYIIPLMQAHFLQPPSPPRSPSPQCPPVNDPPRPPAPQPPPYSAPGYPPPVTPPQQLPWQPLPPPRNPPYPTRYPPPVYPVPPPSQGYHMGQVPGHPVYHPVIPQYPHPPMGYQSQHPPEDLQARQGAMEPCLPPPGHPIPGLVPGPGLLEVPLSAANLANDKTSRAATAAPGFGGREAGETRTRPLMLMDGPLNNRHMVTMVSDLDQKNVPVSSRTPGSPYRGQTSVYLPQGAPLQSVGCGTEDSWDEAATGHGRGVRGRGHRGGRGRGQRRRYPGDVAAGLSSTQFTPSQRGRGHDRGY